MAKIVLAGRSDCPYFARCELLADRLEKNLKKFKLHKIIVQPDKWENWLNNTCSERGWSFTKSPIVWRELIDRGGKGVLIGGANDFQEYAKAYYGVESEMNTLDMQMVSNENKIAKDVADDVERIFKALSTPVNICITNAASPVCYYLVNFLSSGHILGSNVELTVRLLVSSAADVEQVKGTAMEAEDLASGLLRSVTVTTSPLEAFENCSFVIMLDSLNKSRDESEKEWLDRNEEHFNMYATILNYKALKSCKVLLCGSGPVNFNASVIVANASTLLVQNIVAVSSVVEKQAKSVVGEKLGVNQAGVVNLIVWGNINGVRYLDISNCQVHGYNGAVKGPYWASVSAVEMIYDKRWIEKDFPRLVTSQFQKVTKTREYQTGLSTASAIADTLQYWCRGSPEKHIFSLGVYSQGWYDVPVGMFFSFPVKMDPKGYWTVVQDLDITKETKDGIEEAVKDIMNQQVLHLGVEKAEGGSSFTWDKFSEISEITNLFERLSIVKEPHQPPIPEQVYDNKDLDSKVPDKTNQIPELQENTAATAGHIDELLPQDAVSPEDNNRSSEDDNIAPQDDNVSHDDNIPPEDDNLPQDDNVSAVDDILQEADNIAQDKNELPTPDDTPSVE